MMTTRSTPYATLLVGGLSLVFCMTGCQSLRSNPVGQACLEDDQIGGFGDENSGQQYRRGRPQGGGHSGGSGICEDACRPEDFGEDAIPAPPGTQVRAWNDAMICSARQSQYVISRHEWFSGGEQLGPEGRAHVRQLAHTMLGNSEQIVVEVEPTELLSGESLDEALTRTGKLNETRQQAVVVALETAGVPDAQQRVVIDDLDRVGVRGVEAPRVYNRLMGAGRGGQGQGGRVGMGNNNGGGMGGGGGGGGFF